MENLIKKALVYLIIFFMLYAGITSFVNPLNVSVLQVSMKQSQKQDVTVFYTEDEHDIKGLNVNKTISVLDDYKTFYYLIPAKYIYDINLLLHNEGEANVVDIKSVRVITAFSIKDLPAMKNTSFTIEDGEEKINVDTGLVFSVFQLTTHVKMVIVFGSILIILIFSKLINKLFKEKRNIRQNAKVAIFVGSIMFIGFVSTISYDTKKSALSGALPTRPTLSVSALLDTTLMKNTESYLKNQMVLRDELIADYYSFYELLQKDLYSYWYLTSKNGRSIILNNTDIKWDYVYENLANIEKLNNLLVEKEKPYYFYLVPSKEVINIDMFPSFSQYTYYDRVEYFIEEMKAMNINIVDLTEPLVKDTEETGVEIHYYTDHHWTIEAAFVGYQEIVKQLEADGIIDEVKPEFTSEFYEDWFAGSAARSIAYGYNFNQQKDDFKLIYTEGGSYTVSPVFKDKAVVGDFLDILDTKYLNPITKNMNRYAIYSNTKNKIVTNNNLKNGKTIVVLGDSYSGPVAIFLTQHFEKVIFLDQRDYEIGKITKFLEENEYDVVLNINYQDSLGDDSLFDYFSKDGK